MEKSDSVPILTPIAPIEFFDKIREIIREEICSSQFGKPSVTSMETTGLTEKPLYKMHEVCSLFEVTKPTIYEWIKLGKLKRVKIRSRVYFLAADIKQLLES